MRLGFLTCPLVGGISTDDAFAARALEARGVTVVPVDWHSPIDATLEAVVMRSPWDWYHHRDEFRTFLASLASVRPRVFNSPALLEHFADKTYFRSLARLGVATIPTQFFPRAPDVNELSAALEERGWPRAVLKPTFTANAAGARRLVGTEVEEVAKAAQLASITSEWMLQPYVDSIEREGEWALIFFGGDFSHALRKRPKAGDFRVQVEHGGGAEAEVPPPPLLEWAKTVIASVASTALYARVDAVSFEDSWRVMELELVEPELFFRTDPLAPSRFADALLREVRRGAD